MVCLANNFPDDADVFWGSGEHSLEIAVVETGFQASTIPSLRTWALAAYRAPVIWWGRGVAVSVMLLRPPPTIPPMMCRTSAFSQHLSSPCPGHFCLGVEGGMPTA